MEESRELTDSAHAHPDAFLQTARAAFAPGYRIDNARPIEPATDSLLCLSYGCTAVEENFASVAGENSVMGAARFGSTHRTLLLARGPQPSCWHVSRFRMHVLLLLTLTWGSIAHPGLVSLRCRRVQYLTTTLVHRHCRLRNNWSRVLL